MIVPVYNGEKFLERLIQSILQQSFIDFELLLIDDGSTDRSSEICEAFAIQDSRVRLIHQKNAGQSAARNHGIELAQGDYLSFADSDDFLPLDTFKHLYETAQTTKADLTSCLYQAYWDARAQEVKRLETEQNTLFVTEFETKRDAVAEFLKEDKISWTVWGKLFKRSLIGALRFEIGREFEDSYFDYQFLIKSKKVAIVEYVGYYYVKNPESKTRIPFYIEQFDIVTEERKILADVKKDYPDLLAREAYNLSLRYFWLCNKILGEMNLKSILNGKTFSFISRLRKLYREDRVYLKSPSVPRKYQLLFPLAVYCPILAGLLIKSKGR